MNTKEAVVAVIVAALLAGVLGSVVWSVHQGTMGWQRTYETCVQEGNSPIECKVRVGRS